MSKTPKRRHGRGEWMTPLADMTSVTEALAFIAFWPCIGLIGWMAVDPYGFRDAVLGLLGKLAWWLA